MKGNFVIIPFKFRILLLLVLFLSALFAIPLQAQQHMQQDPYTPPGGKVAYAAFTTYPLEAQ